MKKIFIFALFCFVAGAAFGQFPANPNKVRLGNNTSGDGLVYRTGASPSWTPSTVNNAWVAFDTVAGVLYYYQGAAWNAFAPSSGAGLDSTAFRNDTLFIYSPDTTFYEVIDRTITVAGSAGTPQTVDPGQTVTIAAGNGVTTTAGATRTVTVTADTSVLASKTYLTNALVPKLNISDTAAMLAPYQLDITNPVTGTGTSGKVAKFTGTSSIGNGIASDDGTRFSLDDASTSTAKPFDFDSWTTAARPAVPMAGDAGWNTSNTNLDLYSGSAWENPVKSATTTGLGTAQRFSYYDANGRLATATKAGYEASTGEIGFDIGYAGSATGPTLRLGRGAVNSGGLRLRTGQSTSPTTQEALIFWQSSSSQRSVGIWEDGTIAFGTGGGDNPSNFSGYVGSTASFTAGSAQNSFTGSFGTSTDNRIVTQIAGGSINPSSGSATYKTLYLLQGGTGATGTFSGTSINLHAYQALNAQNLGTYYNVWNQVNISSASGGNAVSYSTYYSGNITHASGSTNTTASIKINPTLSISGGTYRAIDIATNAQTAIYQSGSSATNNFAGSTAFGSTSAPARGIDNYGETRLRDLTTDTPTRIVGADADGDLADVSASTGGIKLPSGTTAQRTGVPLTGEIRWNTDNTNLDLYSGSAWENLVKSATATGLGTAKQVFYADANGRAAGSSSFTWEAGKLGIGNVGTGNVFVNGGNTTLTGTYNFGLTSGMTALTTGGGNVALGYNTLAAATTSEFNVAIGYNNLSAVTTGIGKNIAIGLNAATSLKTGVSNIVLGYYGLRADTAGSRNIVIGELALGNSTPSAKDGNIAIGYQMGNSQTDGDNNIGIGYDIDFPSATGSNQLTIGNLIFGTGITGTGTTTAGKVGIRTNAPNRELEVAGEVRITDLTTDTPTRIVGADADGDLGALTLGTGVTIDAGVLNVAASGVSDGDKGDIDVTSSGAVWTIDTNAVTTVKINAGAVTSTKLATGAVTGAVYGTVYYVPVDSINYDATTDLATYSEIHYYMYTGAGATANQVLTVPAASSTYAGKRIWVVSDDADGLDAYGTTITSSSGSTIRYYSGSLAGMADYASYGFSASEGSNAVLLVCVQNPRTLAYRWVVYDGVRTGY